MSNKSKRPTPPVKKPEPKKTPTPATSKAPPTPTMGPPTPAMGPFMGPTIAPQDNTRVATTPTPVQGQKPAEPEKKWWEKNAELDKKENRPPEVDTKAMKAAATSLHKAMSGWGTDEDAIFNTLRGKSPAEIAAIKNEFKKHYDADLDSWIKDELGGDDLKEANALMKGDKVAGVIAGLENSVGFWNDDEAKIENLMRGLNEKELEKLKAHPKWKSVQKSMKSALGGEDEEVFDALVTGDKGKASAIRLDEAMGSSKSWYNPTSWGTDEQGVYDNLSKLPPEERKKAEEAFNARMKAKGKDTNLRDELNTELSKADETRAVASLDNDPILEKAAKIEQTMEGMGTDEATLFKELESMPEADRKKVLESYEKKFGVSLSDRLDGEVGGVDKERASMAAEGKQDDTFKLFYGMNGLGTDEQLLKDTLQGKSKQDIQKMREKWNKEFAGRYGNDFDTAFSKELSGRDHFDIVEIGMRGEPQTPEEKREIMEMQYDYERGSRSTWLGRNMMDVAQNIGFTDSTRVLDMQHERLQEAIGPDGKIAAPDNAIDDLYGYTQDDIKSYREAKDQVTDAIATGAELTVATIATIATAGSASPFLAAALSSALGGVVGMGTKALMQGEAYGLEDIGVDALTTALGAGLGGLSESKHLMSTLDEMSSIFGPKFAAKVAAETGNPLLRSMYLGTTKGMVLGTGHGLAAGVMDEDALRSGFGDYMGSIGENAGMGFLRGSFAGITSSTMSHGAENLWNAEGFGQTMTKEITKNMAIQTALTAADAGTWEGRPEDIFLRFAGAAGEGLMGGIAEGGRDHRADVMEGKFDKKLDLDAAPEVMTDAPTLDTPKIDTDGPDLKVPDVDELPKLLPAPDMPKALPAPAQPEIAGLLPAPKAPAGLLPPGPDLSDNALLDRLANFESSGGSKELVNWALDNFEDPSRIDKLLNDHGG